MRVSARPERKRLRKAARALMEYLWWYTGWKMIPLRHWIANHNEQVRRKRHAQQLVSKYCEALKHIMWVKDCGIDGEDGTGVFRNWPEQERDLMYKIAKEALQGEPK